MPEKHGKRMTAYHSGLLWDQEKRHLVPNTVLFLVLNNIMSLFISIKGLTLLSQIQFYALHSLI
jgi:hypothetical protein